MQIRATNVRPVRAQRPRRRGLHKIFTTFPEGWAAFGLLLIRFAVAFGGFRDAADSMARVDAPGAPSWTFAAVAALVSFALLLGILTPLASCISGLINVRSAAWALFFSHRDATVSSVAAGYLAVMSIALLLLGPGTISVDARLFGRREIKIPDDPRSSSF
jgi:uncharacterized membrane protein YphA (DoxX/SURF4 family)